MLISVFHFRLCLLMLFLSLLVLVSELNMHPIFFITFISTCRFIILSSTEFHQRPTLSSRIPPWGHAHSHPLLHFLFYTIPQDARHFQSSFLDQSPITATPAVPQMQSFQSQMFRCHSSCLLSIVSSITDTSKLFANAEKLGARWERPRISQIMGVKRELKGGKGIEYNRLRESKGSQEGPQRFVLLYSLLLNHMPFTDSGTAMRHSV